LPLHSTVVRALERYQKARLWIIPFGDHFFVGRRVPFTPKDHGFSLHPVASSPTARARRSLGIATFAT
jgi:hypothetical protein